MPMVLSLYLLVEAYEYTTRTAVKIKIVNKADKRNNIIIGKVCVGAVYQNLQYSVRTISR